MPRRFEIFANGEYYHIFNRGVNKQPIFLTTRDYDRALETIKFYLHSQIPLRYSQFMLLQIEQRKEIIGSLTNKPANCNMVCFCLMPNHFHFILRQNSESGITSFIRNFQISYTKYFNTKIDRVGPLLQGQFKAVHIEDDNQLCHLSRYIHLNPITSNIVKDKHSLLEYKWSSFTEFINLSDNQICKKETILSNFNSIEAYKNFILSISDYQRKYHEIKHLVLEGDKKKRKRKIHYLSPHTSEV